MKCDARIAPLLDRAIVIECDKEWGEHTEHGGDLKDYAYEGSVTSFLWGGKQIDEPFVVSLYRAVVTHVYFHLGTATSTISN